MQKIKYFGLKTLLAVLICFSFVSCSKEKNSEKNLLVPETKIEYSEKPVPVVKVERIQTEQKVQPAETDTKSVKPEKPDIDLTVMSSTMIYSTVFQFLIDWENYEGKLIKIRGVYTPFFRQETNRIYHNVVIQDATACCKEGLEFVLGDGTHPDSDYPETGQEIIVTGVFEQYCEDDKMEVMQIHLKNASMEIVH